MPARRRLVAVAAPPAAALLRAGAGCFDVGVVVAGFTLGTCSRAPGPLVRSGHAASIASSILCSSLPAMHARVVVSIWLELCAYTHVRAGEADRQGCLNGSTHSSTARAQSTREVQCTHTQNIHNYELTLNSVLKARDRKTSTVVLCVSNQCATRSRSVGYRCLQSLLTPCSIGWTRIDERARNVQSSKYEASCGTL